MKSMSKLAAAAALALAVLPVLAQTPPPDPWPRVVDLSSGQVLVYQPQVNDWTGNQLSFRAAMAYKKDKAQGQDFGTVTATTRTQVDRVARTVVFEDMRISKIDFPTLPDKGASFSSELTTAFAAQVRSISLDRLQASLVANGVKPSGAVEVANSPPRVIVSNVPAILVPIDGAPVMKPVPNHSRVQRVINTRALILRGGFGDNYYIHVYDGWLSAASLDGPWTQASPGPLIANELKAIAAELSKNNAVDLLSGGPNANPKPSLADGVPVIYTSQAPAELIVFKGQPDFVPIVGTQLLWASNTTSDVLIDITSNTYYVLLAGRWFRGPAMTGPWTFAPSNALPADFARIPAASLAGAVLPTVAGTPQAQAAAIENSIPQTATVPLKGGPTFTPNFDGAPQFVPVAGTTLTYAANSPEPIIQVSPNAYYAVTAGVWFTAAGVTGPWTVATLVPAAIYTIPPSSPIHYVTYVRIYGTTPGYVYVGYTPGYMGTVLDTLRHGGVRHGIFVFAVDRHGLVPASVHVLRRCRAGLQPLRRIHLRFRHGARDRRVDVPVLGRRVLPPVLLGRLSVLRIGERQRLRPLGIDHLLWHAHLVRGRRRCGHHRKRLVLQQPHGNVRHVQRWTSIQRVDRQRVARLRPHRQHRGRRLRERRTRQQLQRLQRTALDRIERERDGRRRQHVPTLRCDHRRPRRLRARGRRVDVQRQDRQHEQLGDRQRRQQPLRRRQRQRLLQHRQRLAAAHDDGNDGRERRHVVGRSRVAGAHRGQQFMG